MGNGNFLAQAYTILAGLNIVIQSLSSQEFLDSKLNSLGSAHQHLGITPIMLEVCFLCSWTSQFLLNLDKNAH